MKRILVLLLACMLIFSIMVSATACNGNKKPDDTDTPGDTPGTETPEDTIDKGPDGSGGIQLPVIPLDPSAPETEEGTDGENTEG